MKLIIILGLFFSSVALFAQNLVPNHSFETYTACPNGASEIAKAAPWTGSGTPDYANACSANSSSTVPNLVYGYQAAHSGNAFARIITYYPNHPTSSYREYLQIKLTSPLTAGVDYTVEFWWNTGHQRYEVDELGLYLSATKPVVGNASYLNYTPQVSTPNNLFLSDTMNWNLHSQTYTAVGGEEWISIGNFKPDTTTDVINTGRNGMVSDIYIDDVSVYDPILSSTTVLEDASSSDDNSIRIHPNPITGTVMHLKVDSDSYDGADFKIINQLGQVVFVKTIDLEVGMNELSLTIPDLVSGLYWASVQSSNGNIMTRKFIKKTN